MADSIPPTSSTGSAPQDVPEDRPPGVPPHPGRKPLPDAVAIYAVAVPEAAPPYDDAPLTPTARRVLLERATQPPTALPPGSPAPAAQPMPGRSLAVGGAWPSKFAQVLAETLAGSRPPDQIVPWTTEQARRRIGQLGPLLATAHRPRVRRLLITSPASGVLEMTVIVGLGPRVRAVAVRLERADNPHSSARRSGAPAAPVQSASAATTAPFARRRGPSDLSAAGARQPGDRPIATGQLDEVSRWRCTAVEAA